MCAFMCEPSEMCRAYASSHLVSYSAPLVGWVAVGATATLPTHTRAIIKNTRKAGTVRVLH